ncbi:hypothetical protein [Brevundimonas sp. R86498]|uniref:hypothetical protein n=1 Tax=Brevundimonas sp. R86498 TaxID=3093845 RepID=UPI0037C8EB55
MPTFFCFIERNTPSVPHMEPLDAATEEEARAQAEALLRSHASGVAAHILLDDVQIATILRLREPDGSGG